MTPKAVAALQRGAKQGDADAMIRLSELYLAGDGVPQNPDQALHWALSAAEAGSPMGAGKAGLLLARTAAGDQDRLEQARNLLRKVAGGGYAPAAEALSDLEGAEAPEDGEEGALQGEAGSEAFGSALSRDRLSALEARAAAGDPKGQFLLGHALAAGRGRPGSASDPARGYALLERACAQNYAPALLALAEAHLDGSAPAPDPAKGEALLARAAESRDANVLAACADIYDQGRTGLLPDAGRPCSCLRRAADMGDADSQFLLAVKLAAGEDLPQNLSQAASYARKAAEQGNVPAQALLSHCCGEGIGVRKDAKAAYFWCSKAADAGREESLLLQARMLAEGRGCEKDPALACEILEGLVLGGTDGAELLLASVLSQRSDSPKDRARGMAMLRRLAGEGCAEAQTLLGGRIDGLEACAPASENVPRIGAQPGKGAGQPGDGEAGCPEAEHEACAEPRTWLDKVAALGRGARRLLGAWLGAKPDEGAQTRRPRLVPGKAEAQARRKP